MTWKNISKIQIIENLTHTMCNFWVHAQKFLFLLFLGKGTFILISLKASVYDLEFAVTASIYDPETVLNPKIGGFTVSMKRVQSNLMGPQCNENTVNLSILFPLWCIVAVFGDCGWTEIHWSFRSEAVWPFDVDQHSPSTSWSNSEWCRIGAICARSSWSWTL